MSETTFSTLESTFGFEVMSMFASSAAGPIGAVSGFVFNLNLGLLFSLMSISTGFDAIPTSLLMSRNFSCFLALVMWLLNLELTRPDLKSTISLIWKLLFAQCFGASYIHDSSDVFSSTGDSTPTFRKG